MRFLLKCTEITAENNKWQFFKRVSNILCKVIGNGLRHTRLLDDDQPGLGWHCHRPLPKTTYPGHLCSRWTYWASPKLGLITNTDCDKTLWHTSKLILLESVSTDIYKVPLFWLVCKEYLTLIVKKCRLLFSAVISEHFSKNRMIISVVAAKKYGISKNVRFLSGHPVDMEITRTAVRSCRTTTRGRVLWTTAAAAVRQFTDYNLLIRA